jgi:hypothetical protein
MALTSLVGSVLPPSGSGPFAPPSLRVGHGPQKTRMERRWHRRGTTPLQGSTRGTLPRGASTGSSSEASFRHAVDEHTINFLVSSAARRDKSLSGLDVGVVRCAPLFKSNRRIGIRAARLFRERRNRRKAVVPVCTDKGERGPNPRSRKRTRCPRPESGRRQRRRQRRVEVALRLLVAHRPQAVLVAAARSRKRRSQSRTVRPSPRRHPSHSRPRQRQRLRLRSAPRYAPPFVRGPFSRFRSKQRGERRRRRPNQGSTRVLEWIVA